MSPLFDGYINPSEFILRPVSSIRNLCTGGHDSQGPVHFDVDALDTGPSKWSQPKEHGEDTTKSEIG